MKQSVRNFPSCLTNKRENPQRPSEWMAISLNNLDFCLRRSGSDTPLSPAMLDSRAFTLFRLLALPLLLASAFAQSAQKAGPLVAEVYPVKSAPFAQTLSTVGTLRANESVTLVSELSRRLVKIHVAEGSAVAAGELLFKLDDTDLVAELGEIDARMKLAESVRQRVNNLLPRKAISQQEYDSSTAAFDILNAERNTKAVQISKTEIRAPFAGRVGVRQVSEGAFVTPATPLITLQDVSRIKVDFPLPERYSGQVKNGQKFTFTVAGNGQVFEGVVTVVEPAIEMETRSLLVRGVCSAPQLLQPGGFADVALKLDSLPNGFMVPSQAIVPSPSGQGVYLIRDGKAVLQAVEIGVRTDHEVQILRGLNEGDVVVTSNLLRIRPGLEVIAAKAP
jgi:membrane fusion protein (multidrug efflux system)